MPKRAFPVDGEAMPESTVFLAVTPSMRLRLATTIENLIALLDEIDGDEDMEDDDSGEPWLGWPEQINQVSRTKMKDGWFAEDGEEQCEDEGAQCDDEGAKEPDGIQWSNDPAVSQDSLEWRGAW